MLPLEKLLLKITLVCSCVGLILFVILQEKEGETDGWKTVSEVHQTPTVTIITGGGKEKPLIVQKTDEVNQGNRVKEEGTEEESYTQGERLEVAGR